MRKVSVIAITVTYLDMTFATTANITSVVETGDYFVRTVICTIIWASFPMSHVDDMRGDRMDDLISRQAAIEAVVAWTVEDRPDIEMPTDLINRIKNMSSAQPDHSGDVNEKVDLIDRQAAIDAVKKNTFRLTFAEEQNCEGHVAWSAEAVYSDVMEGALLELPSAQPERKRGKWKRAYLDHEAMGERLSILYCSVCNQCIAYPVNFCPNCGADMRGEQDET